MILLTWSVIEDTWQRWYFLVLFLQLWLSCLYCFIVAEWNIVKYKTELPSSKLKVWSTEQSIIGLLPPPFSTFFFKKNLIFQWLARSREPLVWNAVRTSFNGQIRFWLCCDLPAVSPLPPGLSWSDKTVLSSPLSSHHSHILSQSTTTNLPFPPELGHKSSRWKSAALFVFRFFSSWFSEQTLKVKRKVKKARVVCFHWYRSFPGCCLTLMLTWRRIGTSWKQLEMLFTSSWGTPSQ